MSTITTRDGNQQYYNDERSGQPITSSRGAPLSAILKVYDDAPHGLTGRLDGDVFDFVALVRK